MIRNLSRTAAALLIAAGSLAVTSCGSRNDAAPAVVVEKTPEKTATTPVVETKPVVPAEQGSSPSALVEALYKAHDAKDGGGVLSDTDRKGMEKYLDSNLTALIWNDYSRTPAGEVGNLDFDPFYNAQDTDIKDFKVGEAKITGETATVVASFMNFDKKENITYSLRQTPAGWRVSNVIYDDRTDLVKIVSAKP